MSKKKPKNNGRQGSKEGKTPENPPPEGSKNWFYGSVTQNNQP